MRAAVCLLLLAAPAQAQIACTMQHAIYAEGETGGTLQFRPARPWEQTGMVLWVMDYTLPDGRVLWGEIGGNMGVSRDVGALFWGCPRPGPDDASLDEAAVEACQVWSGVIYALTEGAAKPLPFPDDPAPESLLLTDLGRQLRYALLDGPADAPWDQVRLVGCGG